MDGSLQGLFFVIFDIFLFFEHMLIEGFFNITHPKTYMPMWRGVNEERCVCSNIICYRNIMHTIAK